MSVIFVTRHAGTVDWLKRRCVQVDRIESHLDLDTVESGDSIIGILPIQMVAEVNKKGASYYHLDIEVPEAYRGKELTADQLDAFGAKLVCYQVEKCGLLNPFGIKGEGDSHSD